MENKSTDDLINEWISNGGKVKKIPPSMKFNPITGERKRPVDFKKHMKHGKFIFTGDQIMSFDLYVKIQSHPVRPNTKVRGYIRGWDRLTNKERKKAAREKVLELDEKYRRKEAAKEESRRLYLEREEKRKLARKAERLRLKEEKRKQKEKCSH